MGHDLFLKESLLGGDPPKGYPSCGLWVEDAAYDNDVVQDVLPNNRVDVANVLGDTREDVPKDRPCPLDEYHKVQQQVMEAFDRGDALHEEAKGMPEGLDQEDNNFNIVDGLKRVVCRSYYTNISLFKDKHFFGHHHPNEHVHNFLCEQ